MGGVQIEDVLGLGMVPEGLMVAGEAQEVFDPQGGGPQHIALQADAVHVPGDHLHHRLHAHLQEEFAGCHGAEAHHRGLVVGDVYRVPVPLQKIGLVAEMLDVGPPRRAAFTGDGLVAGL
jgi:hypothetical protein